MHTQRRFPLAASIAVIVLLAGCSGQSAPVPVTGVSANQSTSPGVAISAMRSNAHGTNARGARGPQLAVSSCTPCATYTNGPSSEEYLQSLRTQTAVSHR